MWGPVLLICGLTLSPQVARVKSNQQNITVLSKWNSRELETTKNHTDVCPLWSVRGERGQCECGSHLDGIVTCNREWGVVLIHHCYCMTYGANGEGPVVGKCFYSCNYSKRLAEGTSNLISIRDNASNETLNDIFCSYWNREGVLCGDCKHGHAPRVYSFDLRCMRCNPDDLYISILKYVTVALCGPTVFLLLILFFRIRITSGKLNTFIFFSQVVSSPPIVRSILYYLEFSKFSQGVYIFIKLVVSFYGIWNLDFFRPLLPGICFSTLNTHQALSLDCTIAAYPLLLLMIMYTLIHLHDRNYKIGVLLWRPFQVCFTRCRQMWKIRNSVVDTFAAFVLLSYSKILNSLFEVSYPLHLYKPSGKHFETIFPYYDASINLLDRGHVIYVPMIIAIFIVFNLLPILLLCAYPTKCGRRCLQCGISHGCLQIFSDAFQGCYKDGTNGTRDLRFFPSVYLVARILLFLIYSATLSHYSYVIMPVFLMGVSLTILVLQPYKKQFDKYNRIDAVMIVLLAMLILSANNISVSDKTDATTVSSYVALTTAVVIAMLPPLYMAVLLAQWIIQRRRSVSVTYEALIDHIE